MKKKYWKNINTCLNQTKEIQAFAGHSTFEQTLKYVRKQSESVDLVPFLDMLAEEPDENPNEIAKIIGIG